MFIVVDGMILLFGFVDFVFLILYGIFGEDGMIQGVFELVGLLYVGNGVLVLFVGMDKYFIKIVFEGVGVSVVLWVMVMWVVLVVYFDFWV